MSRVRPVLVSLSCLAGALTWCASPALADTLRVTSGVIAVGGLQIGSQWSAHERWLEGPGLLMQSGFDEDEFAFFDFASVPMLRRGAPVDLSGVFRSPNPLGAFVNNSLALASAPVMLQFHASPTRLTCSGFSTGCTATAPFTLDAELTLTLDGGRPSIMHLVGAGTAVGDLSPLSFEAFPNIRYNFEPAATPEPSTLSLITTIGLVSGARGFLRRRAARVRPK